MFVNIDIQDFYCPITKHIFLNPVVASDGFTYEKSAIDGWFSTNDCSPVTGITIKNKNYVPNNLLKNMIVGMIDRDKNILSEQYRQMYTINQICKLIDSDMIDVDSINEIVGFCEFNPNIEEEDKLIEKFIKHTDAEKLIGKMPDSEFCVILVNTETEEQFRFVDYCVTLHPSDNVLKYVINRTQHIDMVYNDGTTLLNLAINWDNSICIIEHILQKTTNFNIFSHQSYSWKIFKKLCEMCCDSYIISEKLVEITKKYQSEYIKNIDIVFSDGLKHIHYACMYGTRELVELLHGYGTDIQEKSKHGKSCIALACLECNIDVIDYLIDQDVNLLGDPYCIGSILYDASDLLDIDISLYEKLIKNYTLQKEKSIPQNN